MVNFDYLSKGSGISTFDSLISPKLSKTTKPVTKTLPHSDRDLLAGVLYAEPDPNDPEDVKRVASVINNRAKTTGKDPISVISKGFTSVGQDSSQKFRPFLEGKIGDEPAKRRAYKLADELLSGKFVSSYPYTFFTGDGKKNTYETKDIDKGAWDDPNNILRKRFTKQVTEEEPQTKFNVLDNLISPKGPVINPSAKETLKTLFPDVAERLGAIAESSRQRSFEPLKKSLSEQNKKLTTAEGLQDLVLGFVGGTGKIKGKFPKKEVKVSGGELVPEDSLKGATPKNIPDTQQKPLSQLSDKIPPIDEEVSLVQKITQALKESKPIRGQQEKIYTQERAARIAKAQEVGKKTSGEAGFYSELGQLKGEMPKVQFESLKGKITQEDVDTLFDQVKTSNVLDQWETISARGGLAKIFNGGLPTEGELALLNKVFPKEFIDEVLNKRDLFVKLKDAGFELANIPRSIMSSFDLSAPFRQGIFLLNHPKRFFGAFKDMFKAFKSEEAFKGIQQSIMKKPTYGLMQESKLSLPEMDINLTNREERFMSSWAEKIPVIGKGVRASGRAYVGFLNKLRADVFEDLINKATKLGLDPKNNPDLAKEIAKFVNTASGRGSIGSLERSAKALNSFFFSPRLMMSRLNLLNPNYYVQASPFVRKEALKSLFVFGGYLTSILAMAKLGGAEVGVDARSADFAKIKIDNTRVDIAGGFQQYLRMAAQLITGKYISTTTGKEYTLGEGYKPLTRLGILGRQVESKEAPIFSFITDLLRGQDYAGNQISVPKEIGSRFIPMVAKDVYDVVKDDPSLLPVGLLGAFGFGVQTYTGKKGKTNFDYLSK